MDRGLSRELELISLRESKNTYVRASCFRDRTMLLGHGGFGYLKQFRQFSVDARRRPRGLAGLILQDQRPL